LDSYVVMDSENYGEIMQKNELIAYCSSVYTLFLFATATC